MRTTAATSAFRLQRKDLRVAVLSHETYKRALFFFKSYCLYTGDVPDITISTLKLPRCINQVCTKDARGKKNKEAEKLRLDGNFS